MTDSKKILVVDDDPEIHMFCDIVLASVGHRVVHAYTGAEARTVAPAEVPDAAVLDVMMEEADAGFATAMWFSQEMPRVPILLLSSIADASDGLFDTSVLGVADMANKPISPDELLKRVGRLLARAEKESQG